MKGGRKRGCKEDGGATLQTETRDIRSVFCLISEIMSLRRCVCVSHQRRDN